MALTAEEFYREQKKKGSTSNVTSHTYTDFSKIFYDEIFNLMKGFAEMHVREALEKASEDVFYTTIRDRYRNIIEVNIDKESILNAYPTENIK